MKYSPEQEGQLLERILAMRDDPIAFITFAYPWGQKGTPLEFIRGPWNWQVEELELVAEHMRKVQFALANNLPLPVWRRAWSSGRGPGKSALMGMAAHWHLSTHFGAQTIVAANAEHQLRTKTFPEIARWITMSVHAHWFQIDGLKVYPMEWLAKLVSEQLKIDTLYWNIAGVTWTRENPESFAGAHNAYGLMLIFDEASGIPDKVWDTADGFLTDRTPYRFHFAASQMRRTVGRFYDLFNKRDKFQRWGVRTIDTRYEKCGVDPQWVADFIQTHGEDSDEVRIEIMGVAPKQGETQLINPQLVKDAQIRKAIEAPHDAAAPLIMGVDPAPRGRTVIRFRQGRNARDCCNTDTVTVLQNYDNKQIAQKVADLNLKWKPDAICVDYGMGTGVIDILKHDHKIKVTEVKFGGAPHRTDHNWLVRSGELWQAMADWLVDGLIDSSDRLRQDLVERQWEFSDKDESKKILESKDALRARGVPSPDDADALACTFAVTPPRRDQRTSRGGSRSTRAEGAMF